MISYDTWKATNPADAELGPEHMNIQNAIEASQEYAPYNGMAAFWQGYREYHQGQRSNHCGVDEQAYDRGMQLAMTLKRIDRP